MPHFRITETTSISIHIEAENEDFARTSGREKVKEVNERLIKKGEKLDDVMKGMKEIWKYSKSVQVRKMFEGKK